MSRATVYRHWPDTGPLLLEAMSAGELPFLLDPAPPIRPWLRAGLRRLADELTLPAVQATLAALLHGRLWEPEGAAACERFLRTLDDRLATALDLAVASGETDALPDPSDVAALLIGPLVYRTALQAGAVPDDIIETLVSAVLPEPARGAASGPADPGR